MDKPKRMALMSGLLVILAAVAIFVYARGGANEKPPPSAPGYYTGPMKNKSGRDEYSTEDNKLVAKPESASASGTAAGKKDATNP